MPKNLNKKQIQILNANLIELRSWNSPTVNKLLDKAESNEAIISLYFLSQLTPVKGSNKSSVFDWYTVEEIWNKNASSETLGQTYNKIKNKKFIADVTLQTETMESSYDEENEKKINEFVLTPLVLLDELSHSISNNKRTKDNSNEKELLDHQNLFQNLLNEINEGILKVSDTIKEQIIFKLNEANQKLEEINEAKSKK